LSGEKKRSVVDMPVVLLFATFVLISVFVSLMAFSSRNGLTRLLTKGARESCDYSWLLAIVLALSSHCKVERRINRTVDSITRNDEWESSWSFVEPWLLKIMTRRLLSLVLRIRRSQRSSPRKRRKKRSWF